MNDGVRKFDSWDRRLVIDAVEKLCGVRLTKVGKRDIWWRDESGKSWWILGGQGFQGIPGEMVEDETQVHSDGMLVIAQRKKTYMEVFSASLRRFVSARDMLSRDKGGDYKFNVEVNGDVLFVVGRDKAVLPGVGLKKITEFPYSEWEHMKRKYDIESMSPEGLRSLIAELSQMQVERRDNDETMDR